MPTIDKLTIRVLVDQQHDQFLRGSTVNGVVHEGPGPARSADARNVLHNEWGLSLFLESQREQEQRTILLDFGYTSPAIINNIGLLKVDPGKLQALIVSHGHIDHYGGLIGFLDKYRSVLPRRPEALRRRRGQFLPPRQPRRHRPVRRRRHPRPARDRRAESARRCCAKRRP